MHLYVCARVVGKLVVQKLAKQLHFGLVLGTNTRQTSVV